MSNASENSVAIGPKPWRCELCGYSKGLVEVAGRIECFTIPDCKRRQHERKLATR